MHYTQDLIDEEVVVKVLFIRVQIKSALHFTETNIISSHLGILVKSVIVIKHSGLEVNTIILLKNVARPQILP